MIHGQVIFVPPGHGFVIFPITETATVIEDPIAWLEAPLVARNAGAQVRHVIDNDELTEPTPDVDV